MVSTLVPPLQWISQAVVYFFGAMCSGYMLQNEIKQQRHSDVSFTTRYFKFLSIVCISLGLTYHILLIMSYVPGLCTIMRLLGLISWISQNLSLGFYQLY